MLNKRTNILFDEKLWRKLSVRAKKEKTSVGSLVRRAVEKTYVEDEEVYKQRREALDDILKIRKKVKGINYKELINYGRKY